MFMRIVWRRFDEVKWPEFKQEFLTITPELLGVKGLSARWLLRDMDDSNLGFLISLWDSAESAQQYPTHRIIQRDHRDFFSADIQAHVCEIRSEWRADEVTADAPDLPARA